MSGRTSPGSRPFRSSSALCLSQLRSSNVFPTYGQSIERWVRAPAAAFGPAGSPAARTFTVSRLAPSSTTKSRRGPRGRLVSSEASSASPSSSSRGRLGAAILLPPPSAAPGTRHREHRPQAAHPPPPKMAPGTRPLSRSGRTHFRRAVRPRRKAGRGGGACRTAVSRRSALAAAASGVLPGEARGAARPWRRT